MRRLRGIKALVHDAVDKTVDLVGEGHESTARTVMRVTDRVPPLERPARLVNEIRRMSTWGVLGSIKLVNRAVESVSDAALDLALKVPEAENADDEPLVPMRSDAMAQEGLRASWARDASVGLVNAVIGDHLVARGNGLSQDLRLRFRDRYYAPGALTLPKEKRVAVFVHGLGTTEWSWCLEALAYHGDASVHFGSLLERDLSIPPIFARYNTGLHVSSNGQHLSEALEALVERSPDLEELILIGHSMGGLVLRSACHYGAQHRRTWVNKVKRVFCLGSPHRGAPLEKLGNVLTGVLGAIDLPGTLITARLLEGRSAGIKDLRHGALVDEDWLGKDPDALVDEGRASVPLLPGVAYHFVSATLTQDPEHPLGQLIGDLLVRLPSASGPSNSGPSNSGPSNSGPAVEREHFPIATTRFGGVMHHQLQNHPAVYEVIRAACAE